MSRKTKRGKRRSATLPENLQIPIMKVDRVMHAAAFFFVACSVIFAGTCSATGESIGNNLHDSFYQKTCPQAENVTTKIATEAIDNDPTLAASILRLFFHDCFVKGCDGSILLDSTPSGEPTEKKSPINDKTVRGFEVIDQVKTRLESECPGIVSCADILAFASRDATVFSGLHYYKISAGRRDGTSSLAVDVKGNIPTSIMTINEMTQIFTKKGMSGHDMLALTGAHSIGKLQCSFFDYRIYNYSGTGGRDPKLQPAFGNYLSSICPREEPVSLDKVEEGRGRLVHFDPSSPFRLDNSFYKRLLERRTMLESDQNLADDPTTKRVVRIMAADSKMWANSFTRAMDRLSRVDVITGRVGEIRKNCRAVNSLRGRLF